MINNLGEASNSKPGPEDFIVRSASPDDVGLIAALDQKMWSNWANPGTLYRQLIDLFPETILVAYSPQGKYAGCSVGLVRTNPAVGWILSVDIAEEFRGLGLGKKFVAELLGAFRKLGVKEVMAIIDPGNLSSQRLFASFGFILAGREPDYFGPGKDQDRWRLKLKS